MKGQLAVVVKKRMGRTASATSITVHIAVTSTHAPCLLANHIEKVMVPANANSIRQKYVPRKTLLSRPDRQRYVV